MRNDDTRSVLDDFQNFGSLVDMRATGQSPRPSQNIDLTDKSTIMN